MRLQRGVAVAGIEPRLARELARACLRDWTHTERIAHLAKADVSETQRLLHQLESEGLVAHQTRKYGGEPQVEWNTTLRGSALAGASFLQPITRAKAESLVAGVLDRAAAYNADAHTADDGMTLTVAASPTTGPIAYALEWLGGQASRRLPRTLPDALEVSRGVFGWFT